MHFRRLLVLPSIALIAVLILTGSHGTNNHHRTSTPNRHPRMIATVAALHKQHPPAALQRLRRLQPRERALFRSWIRLVALRAFYDAVWAARPATRWGSPTPISGATCPAGPVKDEIDAVFGVAAAWFESVAMRESGCSPTAYNPSGAAGVAQLLGHEDIVAAVCPGTDPYVSRFWADCNIRAAYVLFEGSGIAPWRL